MHVTLSLPKLNEHVLIYYLTIFVKFTLLN